MPSPQLLLEEPISPELVLVWPELAAIARERLPDPGYSGPAIRVDERVPVGWRQAVVLALACVLLTVTPLVLTALWLGSHAVRHS